MADTTGRIVHIVHEGRPLCDTVPELIKDWPKGNVHKYTRAYTPGLNNCEKCIAASMRLGVSIAPKPTE